MACPELGENSLFACFFKIYLVLARCRFEINLVLAEQI